MELLKECAGWFLSYLLVCWLFVPIFIIAVESDGTDTAKYKESVFTSHALLIFTLILLSTIFLILWLLR